MKALKLVVVGLLFLYATTAKSQIAVNVNLANPPQWGPVGYSDVRYYYLPDVESYYDIQSSKFIYFNGKSWIHRSTLPNHFRNYDLYHGYKVVMTDYRGNTPYSNFRDYKVKYAKGYHGQSQKTYGERPDNQTHSQSDSKQISDKDDHHNGGKENGNGKGKVNKK